MYNMAVYIVLAQT